MKNAVKDLFDLSGKVAIVTGGAMGIGKGIALQLSDAGASVMIVDIVSEKEAEGVLKTIISRGGNVRYIRADLSVVSGFEKIVEDTLDYFDDIHILVNNAGIFKYLPVTDFSEEMWDKTINLNLKAVAFLSQLVVNVMIEKKHGGRIINISSVDSLKPSGNLSPYDASKGGVRMLTRSFAKEVGKYGITVNDIAPGGINTPGAMKIAGDDISVEQFEIMRSQTEQFAKTLPLQRIGEPADVANAVLFLASKASDYMTGSTLVVDGGLLLV